MTIAAALLGTFRLTIDGRSIDPSALGRPSGLRLVKLLLVTPGHRIPREVAAELLWPEADPERSGANLRKSVHLARHALAGIGLPAQAIGGNAVLALDPAIPIDVDVDRLRIAIDAVAVAHAAERVPSLVALETLVDLGGCDLLPEEPYVEWLLPVRERLHRDAVEALLVGAAQARTMGRGALALRLVDRVLQLEPAEEVAHQLAIELHLDAGRIDAARRQLVACAAALADAYDVAPSPQLEGLIDARSRHSGATRTGPAEGEQAEPLRAGGIGALLVSALVEAVAALAGDRPLAPAIIDGRLVGEANARIGSLRA